MHFDLLEPRTHLSATVIRDGNILTITGTASSDTISIDAHKTKFDVVVNGKMWIVRNRDVKLVRIYGDRGNDLIQAYPLRIRCSIEAGTGNDTISGGLGNDTIFGQQGDDVIAGNRGFDYIDAGPGDDEINCDGIDETEVCHGGSGNDTLWFFNDLYATGIENLEPNADGGAAFGTPILFSSLTTQGGKTILELTDVLYSQDNLDYEPIKKLAKDRYVINSTYQIIDGVEPPSLVSHQFDITSIKNATIIFHQEIGTLEETPTVIEFPLFIKG